MSAFKRLKDIFNSATEMQRAGLEYTTLQMTWPLIKDTLPKGDGHPVLFFPGFMTSDAFTLPLRNRVEERGYAVYGWENGFNLGFDEKTAEHIKKRLKEVFDETGEKVTLVGHSLGGVYARELAREFPEMVRGVITLGTPFGKLDDPSSATSEHLTKIYKFFNPKGVQDDIEDIGARGLTPPPVPTTSIFSKDDGVVSWPAAINPKAKEAENIEVYGSHIGMTFNPLTIAAVIDRLGQKEGEWKAFDKKDYPMLVYPAGKCDPPENPEWKADEKAKSLFKKPHHPPKRKHG